MSGPVSRSRSFLPIALLSIFITYSISFALAQTHPSAKDLLRQMTLEEKVAQLSQLPGFDSLSSKSKSAIRRTSSENMARVPSCG